MVALIDDVPSVAELVGRLAADFDAAGAIGDWRAKLACKLIVAAT